MLFALFMLVSGSLISGCDSQGDDGDNGTPPALISENAFALQVDLFQPGSSKQIASKVNFAAAALRVWPVSILVSANLIVPVAVTAAALQDSPELVDGAWRWETTVLVADATVEFELSATPSGSNVDWSMKISAENPLLGQVYDTFELYTARTTVGEQVGTWKLYYKVGGVRTNVLDASFAVTEDDTKSITYSIPVTAAENGGDSVFYETDGDVRHFFWQQLDAGMNHDIEWNAATREGSITATNYNGGVKSCWDANFDDKQCTG